MTKKIEEDITALARRIYVETKVYTDEIRRKEEWIQIKYSERKNLNYYRIFISNKKNKTWYEILINDLA